MSPNGNGIESSSSHGPRGGGEGGDERRPARQHAGDLRTIDDGAALVVDGFAGGAGSGGKLAQRSLVELGADQCLGRVRHTQHRGRDGA
jgi:hypothetical protein